MFPLIVAASVLAAALSKGPDEEEEEFLDEVGLSGPDPDDGEVNPEDRSLLQIMGLVSTRPLYVTTISEDGYVVSADEDMESALEYAENLKSENENIWVTEYTDLPVCLQRRIIDNPDSFGDGYAMGNALRDACSRREGGRSDDHEIWSFNMMEDAPFSEWTSDLKDNQREHVLTEITKTVIDAGTELYGVTGQPEVWSPWIGREIDKTIASPGIAAVTDIDDVKLFDLDVDRSDPDPSHVVTFLVEARIPAPGTKRYEAGNMLKLEEDDNELAMLSEVMDDVVLDTDSEDFDPAEILEKLVEHNHGGGMVLEHGGPSLGSIVILPWNKNYRIKVLSVVPIGQLPLF